MGDTWGGIITGSSGNAVEDDLYTDKVGNHGTVVVVTTNILSVYRGEGL